MSIDEAIDRVYSLLGKHDLHGSPDGEAIGIVLDDLARLASVNAALLRAAKSLRSHAKLFNRDGDAIWDAVRDQADAAIARATERGAIEP